LAASLASGGEREISGARRVEDVMWNG
jgi:hypothetical protein